MKRPALVLFAKQPLPGQAKTRLMPDYTAEEAARIAAFLIEATVRGAALSWDGPVYLYGAPNADHPLFQALAQEFPIILRAQAQGDLGARMCQALRAAITEHGTAAILGCDVPHLEKQNLRQAYKKLAQGKNLIGPTADGGYYFIGLHEAPASLFEDISWGNLDVLAATLVRAKTVGIEFERLTTLQDIDTAANLRVIAEDYEPLKQFCR